MVMPDGEYKDIHYILEESIKIAKKDGGKELLSLSDRIIHSASIYQDKYSLQIATAIYAMAKVMINDYIRRKSSERYNAFIKKAINLLEKGKREFEKREFETYYETIAELLELIGDTDKRIGQYMEEVVRYSMIKKGSKIYTHGISMGRVSEILGISEWELMSKVGWLPEKEYFNFTTLEPRDRMKTMKEIFK